MNTPRTDAATYPADCLGKTQVVHRDLAAALETELREAEQIDNAANHYLSRAEKAEADLAKERARMDDLVADINDAFITLASAADDCDDYAMQNTVFKLEAVRDVLLQYIPNAAMKEASKRTPSQLPEKGKWSKMDSEEMYARTEMSFTPRTDDVLDDNNYFAGSTFIALRKLCRQLEVELGYMTVRAELAEQELTELRAAQTKAPYTEPKAP